MTDNSRITSYYRLHREESSIDDITFNDLNLDAVFKKIDRTESSLGDEVLYFLMRNPKESLAEIDSLEKDLDLLKENSADTKKAENELRKLSKLKKVSVFEYLYHLDKAKERSLISLLLPMILMVLALLSIFIDSTLGIILSAGVFIFNTIRYFNYLKDVKPYLVSFSYIIKAIKTGERIKYIDKSEIKDFENIKRFSFILGNLSGVTANGGSGNPFDLILDLFKMGFHLDILRFYGMLSVLKKYRDEIERYLYHLGKIDACISILKLRDKNKDISIPEFISEKSIEATDIYHPLIKEPVKNSISVKKSVLLTGANASGKSTFLRTIAINAILAQSINTVFAFSYKAPLFHVMSSMDISDSIDRSESFYIAEVKSLKRMLEYKEEGYKLFVVDEVLKGTNTIERISAGAEILKHLDSADAFVFGATHDREICSLLKDSFLDYHFSEEITGDDYSFSYTLKEGMSDSTNAISLLERMGFPSGITDGAREIASSYEKTGTYSILT